MTLEEELKQLLYYYGKEQRELSERTCKEIWKIFKKIKEDVTRSSL